MRKVLIAAIGVMLAGPALAQTHVTQPFHYFFDEVTTAVPGVNHFQIKVDGGAPGTVTTSAGVVSGTNTTFSVLASPTLAVGTHSVVVGSCTTADSVVGCADSAPLSFVLDPTAPPAPVNVRVGP